MISIRIDVADLDRLARTVENKVGKVTQSAAKALTSTAYSVRKAMNEELSSKLNNPTSYTTRQAIQVVEATPGNLRAIVGVGVK